MSEKKRFALFPRQYGLFPYIFLVYLLMPGYYVSQESSFKQIFGYLLLFLFLFTYRQLYVSSEAKNMFSFWLFMQIGIILILSLFYNVNNVFLGFFSAHFIGWYQQKKIFFYMLMFLAGAIILPLLIHMAAHDFERSIFYFTPFIIIMLVAPFGIRSMVSRMELERKLDEANEQIKELVKREERMRIARDLHDTLGHTLSLLALKSQLVGKLAVKDPERAHKEAQEMERTARSALSQVRELVSDMRTITVAEEIIEVQALLQTAGIALHLNGDSDVSDIPYLTQNILSLCLKEAVTNVVKHSEAKNCYVSICSLEGEVVIAIEDDGVGISDPTRLGNGLKGMEERLELIDGALQLTSKQGTRLEITVPIIIKEREAEDVS
ncbi:sensor histidine kinase YvfT [Robertmurraya siralis]|uniref:histidine kinase n=1 Tax=Robertmurraya siralis TaxID=77777 RepID=A0A919WDR6_9BACI|nr:sensor histidine kinase [Robertmurraya siralis]PAE19404.1 two-component sensor histidine kinase [Bacillus sp. 7504-2]GIN60060.1 sensor histidine kinase YvfT [Robertmurraya siralis]